jgi:predicted GIY-YIG superfamily endonuclease
MYSIYKILYKDFCYVGITKDFKARIREHKHSCLNQKTKGYNLKVYQVIRANEGWEAWTKEVVETTDDKTKERYWIKQISNLNVRMLTRTTKEWYELNKEKYTEKINCECGGKYTYSQKSTHFKTNKHLTHINTNG